jgi:hypothetical protein
MAALSQPASELRSDSTNSISNASGRCCRYSRVLPCPLQGSSRSCVHSSRRSGAERHSTRRCIPILRSRGRGRICSWIWARWSPRDAAHKECERVNIRLKSTQDGILPILLRESSLRPAGSSDATPPRLGTGYGVWCCNCFGDCIGIRRYPHCPNRCALRSALSETFETRNMDISQPAYRKITGGLLCAAHTGLASKSSRECVHRGHWILRSPSRFSYTPATASRVSMDGIYPVDRLRFVDRLDVRDVDDHGLVV